MTARRWVPIVAGVAIFIVFIGIGVVVFSAAWIRERVHVEGTTAPSATAAFDEVTRRFSGKPAMIELADEQVATHVPPRSASRTTLTTLHVLVWDPDDGRLARVEVPFWLLRLKETPIRFANYTTGAVDLDVPVTAADIERFGPGIVVDLRRDGHERVMLWVE